MSIELRPVPTRSQRCLIVRTLLGPSGRARSIDEPILRRDRNVGPALEEMPPADDSQGFLVLDQAERRLVLRGFAVASLIEGRLTGRRQASAARGLQGHAFTA